MATVRDIVNGALRKIGVLDIAEEADAESAQIALDAYNGIMAEHQVAGWLETFTAQALGDTVPLATAYDEALKAAVAVRIAEGFGRPVTPRVANEATRLGSMLANAWWSDPLNIHRSERGLWEPRPGEFTVET